MPDSPDYSKYLPGSSRFSLQDMGELAARLGSPDTFDRRGEVIWMDDCRHGLGAWLYNTWGTGGEIYVDSHFSLFSGYEIVMIAGATDILAAQLQKFLAFYYVKRIGGEIGVGFETDFSGYYMQLKQDDGVKELRATFRIDPTTKAYMIRDADAGYVTIDNYVTIQHAYGFFLPIKLVCDFETEKYCRLIINDREYDLTDYTLTTHDTSNMKHYAIVNYLYSSEGENARARQHYAIVTANEP